MGASARATWTGPWAVADGTIGHRIWPGDPEELVAALLTIGFFESRLDPRVQAGLCPLWGCDGPRAGLAHSQWQIEASPLVPRVEWLAIVGTAPVQVEDAAWAAARVLSYQRGHCAARSAAWAYPTLAGYATGRSCAWGPARKRAAMLWRIDSRIRALEGLSTGASR